MKNNKTRILFLANIPVPDISLSYGGATILAENILKFIKSDPRLIVEHYPIRNTWRPKLHIFNHFIWVIRFPFILRRFDIISIHGTWDFNFTTAPFLWIWAKLFRKKIVYQFIGGDFLHQYKNLPEFVKFIYKKTLLKSDTVFFETKELMEFFKKERLKNCVWMPNARKNSGKIKKDNIFRKKFLYLSRIIPEKGVNEIIEVSNRLPDDYSIDIIGPLNERYFTENELNRGRANFFNKLINPKDLNKTLSQYDVLLLPTYFTGEGYPGIVIDCLSLGIPVITTHWMSLPEMVEHKYNGLLIKIKDIDELEQAILHFNQVNYPTYQYNALKSFEQFDSDCVFQKIIKSYLDE